MRPAAVPMVVLGLMQAYLRSWRAVTVAGGMQRAQSTVEHGGTLVTAGVGSGCGDAAESPVMSMVRARLMESELLSDEDADDDARSQAFASAHL